MKKRIIQPPNDSPMDSLTAPKTPPISPKKSLKL